MPLFLFLLFFAGVNGVVLPSRMEGQYALETLHTVQVKVGTPGRLMRLRVDFDSNLLVTKIPLQLISRSYSPFGGGSDVVHFGGRDYRVLAHADGGALAAALGCGGCDGVLGLGTGSRIWLQASRATFTAGAVLLDQELVAFTRSLGEKGSIQCLPGFTNICTAHATVRGHPVVVFFGLPASKTVVPKPVFERYTAGLNIGINDPADWGDLEFVFPGIGGEDNRFTLRQEDLVSKSRRGGFDLLLLSGGVDNTTVVLSQSSWRSLFLRKDHKTGLAQVTSWCVRKHWSTYALLVLLVESVLFLYWLLTPSGAWSVSHKEAWKVVAEACGAILAVVTYALPMTQTALKGHVEVNIFLGGLLVNQILWQIYAGFVYFGVAKDYFGGLSLTSPSSRKRLHPRLYLAMSMSNETILLVLAWLLILETRVETLGGFFSLLFVLFLLGNLLYHTLLVIYVPTGDRWSFVWALYWTNAILILVVGVVIVEVHVMQEFISRFIPALPRIIPYISAVVYAAAILLVSGVAKLRSRLEFFLRQQALKTK